MAASLASEPTRGHDEAEARLPKDFRALHLPNAGRSTPLPQYEKTQSVPFTLTLQEEKDNPGQFQLVVNINTDEKPAAQPGTSPLPQKKLVAKLQDLPSLGYNVSPLYRTQKSSPPTTPQWERPEWSELDAIPEDFLHKVVPDWGVTFTRSASTASTQSRRLADIKAKIKKSGKGFVVRLLKGSSTESSEVAEVHLAHNAQGIVPEDLNLGESVELDSTEISRTQSQCSDRGDEQTVFEIGERTPRASPRLLPISSRDSLENVTPRLSISEDSIWPSDAETVTHESRPSGEPWDDVSRAMDLLSTAPSSVPTRSNSTTSIVKTPTRGLSVVGPVKRVNKGERRAPKVRSNRLDRSDAHKSFKRRSPRNLSLASNTGYNPTQDSTPRLAPTVFNHMTSDDEPESEASTTYQPRRDSYNQRNELRRGKSLEETGPSTKSQTRLRLQTNVPRPSSTNTSPVTRRAKRSPRTRKPKSSSTSVDLGAVQPHSGSAVWEEVGQSQQLREAVERILGGVENQDDRLDEKDPIPTIQEPIDIEAVGEIPLPPGLEVRPSPISTTSPAATFARLALNALSSKGFSILDDLRVRYGSEPPVAPNRVRVRWTCSCGEQLYDDFIENRRGAARALEAYLNRPRSHTPSSPSGRTSTESTMSSVFGSLSTSSTLTTPASTYGGSSPWGNRDSKNSPSRIASNNHFSVRIGGYPDEQWLLTCANEGKFTPKIVHLDVNAGRIKSDKDLALALREHYEQLNRKWFRMFKLRGLNTIEFVQFEVHRNRLADIRASPSMPPTTLTKDTYSFEPIDLLPPVGSTYLLHLFKHPSDYDNELITYLRAPKRRQRLDFGLGWGINLVEDFLVERVWLLIVGGFGFGSAVFAVVWVAWARDVQGAFGVASWAVGLAGLLIMGLQAWLG